MESEKKVPQVNNDTYTALAQRLFNLKTDYSDMNADAVFDAWRVAGGGNFMLQFPTVQNQRVKSVNTRPAEYDKNEIAKFVDNPAEHEKALRQVSASLASSAKTYDLILQTYQDIMTYDWYIYPSGSVEKVDYDTMIREYSLANKVAQEINPKSKGHEIVGLCMQYGKVFFTPRVSVDKAHNKVNYAFLQQLPEDYCKIVGFNNGVGKYTVAFDMMYFMQAGTTPEQFGDLFTPYWGSFSQVVERPTEDKYVYSSKDPKINIDKFKAKKINETAGNPRWANTGKQWFYWVTLPADKVITFEINDRNPYVVPPESGLMVSMTQIPNYEAAQMEIVLNPLTSIMSGELETYDTHGVPNADPVAVSPAMRKLFEKFWYEMLEKNNTSGIGLFLAPAKNLKLQTISDTVSNTNIATTAISDQIQKAGLASVIPTTNDPKVGVAEISAKVNARYALPVYWAFERLFNSLFENMKFKSSFKFKMFGDIFTRKEEMENARAGMTLGILSDTLKYDAMQGHSLLDDLAISDFVDKTGILKKRTPLSSTYGANMQDGKSVRSVENPVNDDGGRPTEDGSQSSQKTEKTTI